MPADSGKYDDVAQLVSNITGADAAMVIIAGGTRGTGFSVISKNAGYLLSLTKALRLVCDDIDEQNERAMAVAVQLIPKTDGRS
jgi:hypothetical protein